jgi:hypothetical protein
MALNAQLYSKLVSNQPQSTLISTCAVISGDGAGTNAFVVTDPTAIERLDIVDENYQGTFTSTTLHSLTLYSTLQLGAATIATAGAGYTASTTSVNVTLNVGGNATAKGTVTTDATGAITSVTVTDGGTEYSLSSSGFATAVPTAASGTPSIGTPSSAASLTIALSTGSGTGSITARGWCQASDEISIATLIPAAAANLGTNFPTGSDGFLVSLRRSAGNSCIARAYTVGSPATANMVCTRVRQGVYKFAFNSARVSGGLPPIVDYSASLFLQQGPGVTNKSYAYFADMGLDGKTDGGLMFGVSAAPLNVDPVNGDIYVVCVDHNNVPCDPYPGSQLQVSVLLRNSSAVV